MKERKERNKRKLDKKSSSSMKYSDLIIELENNASLFEKMAKNLAIRDNLLKHPK